MLSGKPCLPLRSLVTSFFFVSFSSQPPGTSSPPHSKCERNHPRWNASRIGILILCFCEESCPVYKRELESKPQIPADAPASDVTEDYVCRNQRREKEKAKKRVENIDRCQSRLRELNGPAIVAHAARKVWVHTSG